MTASPTTASPASASAGPAFPGDPVDLLVIGGGANGAGVARDAAGRGMSVVMVEKDDLAEHTSSRSGKLIHGGLRYLEYYEFRLVREALIEREILLRAAPHIIWPMRFVLPHSPEQRPRWLIRLGLFLYDNLGGRAKLPGTRSLDMRRDPVGRAVRDDFPKAFEYSDCWVEDARLVVLNAKDAAERGAIVLPRTRCVTARRDGKLWVAELEDRETGERQTVRARGLVNAAGPWVETFLRQNLGSNSARKVRLVKGSHIVVPKFWEGEQAYLLQNDDKRVIFVNPYQDGLALIGTTDIPYEGDAADAKIAEDEVAYLLRVCNRYFKRKLLPSDILNSFAGVRPLYDDAADKNASAVTRDYVFQVEGGDDGKAPLLSAFGGKITTFRKLAEHALEKLKPFYPEMGPAWTATAPLPGGDMPESDFDAFLSELHGAHPWLPEDLARHYARLYGTRATRLLNGATSLDGLGRHFGGKLYEAEARYLMDEEWAQSAADVLERRTKHGLYLSGSEKVAFADWLADAAPTRATGEAA